MATQEGMEKGFELLSRQMEPFEDELDDNHLPLVEPEKYWEVPAEFPGVQIEAHAPLTPEGYDEYEQLEAASAAALKNGNLPDP